MPGTGELRIASLFQKPRFRGYWEVYDLPAFLPSGDVCVPVPEASVHFTPEPAQKANNRPCFNTKPGTNKGTCNLLVIAGCNFIIVLPLHFIETSLHVTNDRSRLQEMEQALKELAKSGIIGSFNHGTN